MARAWTQKDEQRWRRLAKEAQTPQRDPAEPDDLLFRDVVAGCAAYLLAVVLNRLRLAAPPARSLAREIRAANDARAVQSWIWEPIAEPTPPGERRTPEG